MQDISLLIYVLIFGGLITILFWVIWRKLYFSCEYPPETKKSLISLFSLFLIIFIFFAIICLWFSQDNGFVVTIEYPDNGTITNKIPIDTGGTISGKDIDGLDSLWLVTAREPNGPYYPQEPIHPIRGKWHGPAYISDGSGLQNVFLVATDEEGNKEFLNSTMNVTHGGNITQCNPSHINILNGVVVQNPEDIKNTSSF